MKYKNFRQRVITISEANKILKTLIKTGIIIIYVSRFENIDEVKLRYTDFYYSKYAIVKENDSNMFIETNKYEPKYKATRYICNLNGELRAEVKGMQCFNELQRWCFKAKSAKKYNWKELDNYYDTDTGRYLCSSKPLIGFSPQYEKVELKEVYEYDLNSAYSSIMLQGIPNVNKPYFNCKIKYNQVGFLLDLDLTMIDKPGCKADIVFDIIQLTNSQKKYIEKLYDQKENSINTLQHDSIKLKLNASIGYYQRYNPFIRAYIVQKCNNVISGLLDNNSIIWNTDAIISLKRRPELELGTKIGQFKEIKINRFVYTGNNYQINNEIPKYRGIPKAWFKDKPFDLLKDTLPERCNKYKYDEVNNKLVRNEEYYGEKKINQSTES